MAGQNIWLCQSALATLRHNKNVNGSKSTGPARLVSAFMRCG